MKISRFASIAALLSTFALVACESSTSSDEGSQGPFRGEPNYFCKVTNGDNWVQMELNVPNKKGMVRKINLHADGTYDEYYEETYFNLQSWQMKEMCLEYEDGFKEKGAENIKCGNGRFSATRNYFKVRENLLGDVQRDFTEQCADYDEEWKRGDYIRYDDDDDDGNNVPNGNASSSHLPENCQIDAQGNVLRASIVYSDWSMIAYAVFEADRVKEEYDFAGIYDSYAAHSVNVCKLIQEDDENVVCETNRIFGDDMWAAEDRITIDEAKLYAEESCRMLMSGRYTLEQFVSSM